MNKHAKKAFISINQLTWFFLMLSAWPFDWFSNFPLDKNLIEFINTPQDIMFSPGHF